MENKLNCIVTLIFLFTFSALAIDMYEPVSFHKLDNGMEIILSTSDKADTTKIELQVDVGTIVENSKNRGVNHLLEHILFKDSDLKDDQTYLQVIKEMGGKINGSSSYRVTKYYATVPGDKSEWVTKTFHKMIFDNIPNEVSMERAKKSVLIEIGQPSFIADIAGFWPSELLFKFSQSLNLRRGYWEEMYGYKHHNRGSSRDRERLTTIGMKLDTVLEHFNNYYHPENMRLFITGKFDQNQMLSLVKETFGSVKKVTHLKIPKDKYVDSKKSYIKKHLSPSSSSASVSVGQNISEMSGSELISFQTYLDFLSHRIMKELRNKKGETYSAYPNLVYWDGIGYGIVNFQTQNENLDENYKFVKSLIQNEVIQGKITQEQFEEAISLSKKQRFELSDFSSDRLLQFAKSYYSFKKDYNEEQSPYAVIKNLTLEQYKADLKKIFDKNRVYESVSKPFIFFKWEGIVSYFFHLIMAIFLFKVVWGKKLITKDYIESRDLAHMPGMIFEFIGLLLFVAFVEVLTISKLNFFLVDMLPGFESHIAPQYIYESVASYGSWFFLFFLMSKIPTKILFNEDKVVLKSMAFSYRGFQKSDVEDVAVMHWWNLLIKPSCWLSFKFRFFFLDPFFWRKGVLIKLKTGKTYFLGSSDSEHIAQRILQTPKIELVVVSEVPEVENIDKLAS